jgi:hypothetical protein
MRDFAYYLTYGLISIVFIALGLTGCIARGTSDLWTLFAIGIITLSANLIISITHLNYKRGIK